MSLENILNQFKGEIAHFIASAIVDIDSGFSLASTSLDPNFDPVVASPTYAELVKTNTRAMSLLNRDPHETEDILITTAGAYLLIRILGTHYYHGLAVSRDASMGLCRVIMKKYEPLFLKSLRMLQS